MQTRGILLVSRILGGGFEDVEDSHFDYPMVKVHGTVPPQVMLVQG